MKFGGLQLQPGTRWNCGLSDEEIRRYESEVGARFPSAFRAHLREMNGTNLPAIDVRGSSGEPIRFVQGFYSYQQDIELVHQLINEAEKDPNQLRATLVEEGYQLPDDAKFVPIFAHRYVVCAPTQDESVVLSIWDPTDALVYGRTLQEYLENEVFPKRP